MRFDVNTLEFDKIVKQIEQFAETAQGKEAVRALTPTEDQATIEKNLHETLEGKWFVEEGLNPVFSGVYDIREALKRARVQGVLAISDFLDIRHHIDATKRIKREVFRLSELLEKPIGLEAYAEGLIVCVDLRKAIAQVLDDQGQILSTASAELKIIRRDMDITDRRIKQTLETVLKKETKKLTEQLITMRHNRFVVPVKLSEKYNLKGTIMDYSSSGETAYIEPEAVRELSSTKIRLEADEKREIERILYQLTVHVHDNHAYLKENHNLLSHLDFVFAKAMYAHATESIKPALKSPFHLVKARHPLISKEEVVANTITFDEGVKTMVITGSNTGGKTVTLKTTGLLAIMAQSGLLIPVSVNSSLPVFSQIRADIGDEQSIEQSLSTFSSHMRNIVDILNTVTDKSLILLDELGSGTDPNEGSSLAMSILDDLDAQDVLVMATTHYPELKAYAYTKASIVNASVEFDENTLKPTYRLLLRTPGESHAFLIGERLGLPSRIIKNAKARALVSKTEVSDLITNLKRESTRLDGLIQEHERLLKESEQTKKETDLLKRSLQHEKETLKEKMTLENQRILESLKQDGLALISELEQLKIKPFKEHELAEVKYRIRSMNASVEKTSDTEDHPYKQGDTVYILKFNRYGELLKKQKNDQWLVKMGRLNSVFKETEFEYAENTEKPKEKTRTKINEPEKKPVHAELDLRGMRVHEAEESLAKYLDDCTVSNLPFASIIHGFGTLALRKMVQNTLKNNPLVKSYRDGEGGEGGQGVTVVYFK